MKKRTGLAECYRAAMLAVAALLVMPSIAEAHLGLRWDGAGILLGDASPADDRQLNAQTWRVAQNRPSAAAIDAARQRNGLPASARAVGWRLVDGGGGKVWKIIFRVGNRQVAVEIPAGG